MNWNDYFPKGIMPDLSQVSAFTGSPLWGELCAHLEDTYDVLPAVEHSGCSGASGWNLKYRKSGRALCTLYPAEGFFTALVCIGRKEEMQAEFQLSSCTDYIQQLYWNTKLYNGGRWLMIDVTSADILNDVKELIALRVKKK